MDTGLLCCVEPSIVQWTRKPTNLHTEGLIINPPSINEATEGGSVACRTPDSCVQKSEHSCFLRFGFAGYNGARAWEYRAQT